jgi:hypothetical protein
MGQAFEFSEMVFKKLGIFQRIGWPFACRKLMNCVACGLLSSTPEQINSKVDDGHHQAAKYDSDQ